jgi:hypothetical protein
VVYAPAFVLDKREVRAVHAFKWDPQEEVMARLREELIASGHEKAKEEVEVRYAVPDFSTRVLRLDGPDGRCRLEGLRKELSTLEEVEFFSGCLGGFSSTDHSRQHFQRREAYENCGSSSCPLTARLTEKLSVSLMPKSPKSKRACKKMKGGDRCLRNLQQPCTSKCDRKSRKRSVFFFFSSPRRHGGWLI